MSNELLRNKLMKEKFFKVMKDGGRVSPESLLPKDFSIGSDYSAWVSEDEKIEAIENIVKDSN